MIKSSKNSDPFQVHRWEPVPGFQGYFVSTHGQVASRRRGGWHVLNPWKTADGYMQANLGGRKLYVHRLMAMTFISDPPFEDAVVDHIDERRDHNDLSNLRWLRRADNVREAARNRAVRRAEIASKH